MSEKFHNKYRIPSARLQNWDYGWNAMYFITICTQNKECYFGDVVAGKMVLSNVGVIADIMWYEIKNHANIELGEFKVMPNHIHGILTINNIKNDVSKDDDENGGNVETTHALSLPEKTIGQQRFQHLGKNSLSSIVGSFKSAVSKHAHRLNLEFNWQERFYDHIIRNDESFQKITNYIVNNPLNWSSDKFFDKS